MYRSILVGTDGSPTAAIAVDRAVSLARTFDAALTLASVGSPDTTQETLVAEQRRLGDTGVDLRTQALEGDAAHVLVDFADSGAFDLLVVGNKGMTGLSRFVTVSVPNKVSHHASCALLIVRTT